MPSLTRISHRFEGPYIRCSFQLILDRDMPDSFPPYCYIYHYHVDVVVFSTVISLTTQFPFCKIKITYMGLPNKCHQLCSIQWALTIPWGTNISSQASILLTEGIGISSWKRPSPLLLFLSAQTMNFTSSCQIFCRNSLPESNSDSHLTSHASPVL